MKVFLFSLSLVFISNITFSQAPNFKVNQKVDDFTGDTTVYTSWIDVNNTFWKGGHKVLFRFKYQEGQVLLECRFSLGSRNAVVKEGALFYIRMVDGEVLELYNRSQQNTYTRQLDSHEMPASTFWLFTNFAISKEELEKLATVNIEKFRLVTTAGFVEEEPQSKSHQRETLVSANMFYNYMEYYWSN